MALGYPYPIQSSTRPFGASTIYGIQQDTIPVGCMGVNDHAVVQHAAGATMGVDVGPGSAYVPFGTPAAIGQLGGLRQVENSAANYSGTTGSVGTDWTGSFTTADGTNPRIDSVYLVVQDSNLDASGHLRAVYQVVNGTPTSGATLDNRTGAAAAPSVSSILLADVLISANQTTVTTAKIRDRRPIGPNVNPPLFSTIDQVTFEPCMGVPVVSGALLGATNAQAACAMWLPRRIVGATKVRWTYRQTATPTTGNWNIAVCDSSGRPIQATGAVAFAGAANANTQAAGTITAQTFEAGMYWVLYGQTLSAGASVTALVAAYRASLYPSSGVNTFAFSSTGGTTFPAAINGSSGGLNDSGAGGTDTQYGVPICSLSVG